MKILNHDAAKEIPEAPVVLPPTHPDDLLLQRLVKGRKVPDYNPDEDEVPAFRNPRHP